MLSSYRVAEVVRFTGISVHMWLTHDWAAVDIGAVGVLSFRWLFLPATFRCLTGKI